MKKRDCGKSSELKKGQISVFVILSVLIVLIIIFYFLIKLNYIELGRVSPDVKPVYNFIENCVEQTSSDAVYYIGENGGYFISPNNSLDNGIPIYFNKGEVSIPSLNDIEKELEMYVNEMLFFCFRNFNDFSDFDVKQGEVKSEVKILPGKVVFEIDSPLSVSKGDKTYVFNDFNNEIDVRLFEIQKVSSEAVKIQQEYPEDICLSCLSDLAIENDLIIKMMDYQESVIFLITDSESKINNEEYVFYFAVKLDENE